MTEKRATTSWLRRRLAAGLTLSELARRAEVNKGSLSRIERGWPATDVEAAKLLAALDAADVPDTEAAS